MGGLYNKYNFPKTYVCYVLRSTLIHDIKGPCKTITYNTDLLTFGIRQK